MNAVAPKRSKRLAVEPLEGRALLSHTAAAFPAPMRAMAIVNHPERAIRTDPAGVAAILSALNGGPGSEFVSLIRHEVRNLSSVIGGFESGRITQYTIAGLVAKIPNWQPAYTGSPYDRMALTLAGAILIKGNTLELGAITRGPFAEDNATTTVVFAINRGAGSSLGPYFAARPSITPDALVTITVGPYGRTYSGTVTDLTTGASQTISSQNILVAGPVVRVYLSTSLLPSKGFSIAHDRFAAWTALAPNRGIASVGSFAPENAMIPIGIG